MIQLAQMLADSSVSDTVKGEIRDKLLSNPDKVYFPNFGSGDNILKKGITVDNVLFTIPGTDIQIYWYGFLIAIGILLAMIYGFSKMKSAGIDPDRATDAVIGGIIGAILGARLYYVIFDDDVTIKQFFQIRDGGLAIYGGIIGAILVGGIIAKIHKLKIPALLDVVAPCFLIGQCIGRWGNFFNQEAFGNNTDMPWGMMSFKTINYIAEKGYSEDQVSQFVPVHPCFLYESLWCLLGFILLHFYFKHRKFDGEVILMYAGWYGLGRFFIEALRTDSLFLGNIKVSQLVAGACVLAAVILIIVFRNITKRNENYKFFYETELSKAQLSEYDSYREETKEKKELKAKIKEAKAKGESFVEFEKEYEEKFGKEAKKKRLEEAAKKDVEEEVKEDYESIIDEDEETDEKTEATTSEDVSEEKTEVTTSEDVSEEKSQDKTDEEESK